ncbi:hypothetical protein [Cupriavidus lacunae]|uniref:hypothetical protein n=1 Tax=Cupriavidus lacunae TaxID=2666307 RepID=UPI001058A500|nr:hypothetical protein [Cupriavidus lacunae]
MQVWRLIVFFALLQLVFDVLLPQKNRIDPQDWYAGTFLIANNKSRILAFFLVLFSAISVLERKYFRWVAVAIPVCVSAYLGHSYASYGFVTCALLLSYMFRRPIVGVVSIGLAVICSKIFADWLIQQSFDNHELSMLLMYNYARYFDPVSGVFALYKYGADALMESGFMGTGLGSFVSRAANFFSTPLYRGIPETMIVYGEYFKAATPYGLSALFVPIVEQGFLGVAYVMLIIGLLVRAFGSDFWGRFCFFYIIVILLYSPVMLEFSEFFIYVATGVSALRVLRSGQSSSRATMRVVVAR